MLKKIPVYVSIGLLLMSCGGHEQPPVPVAPEGMQLLNLQRFGKPFAIYVPDTTRAPLEITEQPTGALDVKVGKNFGISIYEQEADINLKKIDIKEDELNRLKQYVKEEPAAILWESEIVKPEFHFLVNARAGHMMYSFEDTKELAPGAYTQEAIERMFNSSKNIVVDVGAQ